MSCFVPVAEQVAHTLHEDNEGRSRNAGAQQGADALVEFRIFPKDRSMARASRASP